MSHHPRKPCRSCGEVRIVWGGPAWLTSAGLCAACWMSQVSDPAKTRATERPERRIYGETAVAIVIDEAPATPVPVQLELWGSA